MVVSAVVGVVDPWSRGGPKAGHVPAATLRLAATAGCSTRPDIPERYIPHALRSLLSVATLRLFRGPPIARNRRSWKCHRCVEFCRKAISLCPILFPVQ
jgi:hypothetical protein